MHLNYADEDKMKRKKEGNRSELRFSPDLDVSPVARSSRRLYNGERRLGRCDSGPDLLIATSRCSDGAFSGGHSGAAPVHGALGLGPPMRGR